MRLPTNPWLMVLALAALLALIALVSNISTLAEFSGELVVYNGARRSVSLFVNAGTLWAGLSVLAGWMVGRARPERWHGAAEAARRAALAGTLAGVTALGIHYSVGALTGVLPRTSFVDNGSWFAVGLATGPVLGLIGWVARRPDKLGLAARLVVPAAAIVETLLGLDHLTRVPPGMEESFILPVRVFVVVLMASGVLGGAAVLRPWLGPALLRSRSGFRMPSAGGPGARPPTCGRRPDRRRGRDHRPAR